MRFIVYCNPPKSTHQASARILKRKDGTQFIGKMSNSKGKRVRDNLMTLFMPHRPSEPLEGPVELRVTWAYGWRSSETKKRKVMPYRWCDKRPDCDNLVKLVKDVLTDLGFWRDDSQVAKLTFQKVWTHKPHISIMIEGLE